jgi:hypothetical protein
VALIDLAEDIQRENVYVHTVEVDAAHVPPYSIVSEYGVLCMHAAVSPLHTTVQYDIDSILLLKTSILYL